MTKHLMAIAALGAVVACTANALPSADENTYAETTYEAAPMAYAPVHEVAPVSCDVRATRTANGVLIEAVAHADEAIDGEYSLVIRKTGGGGSADIEQSGPFAARAGSSVTLGGAELSRGYYSAELVLFDDAGELCRGDL